MARRSSRRSRPRRSFRTFALANVLLWGVLGLWLLTQPAERRQEAWHLVRNAVQGGKQITPLEVIGDLWRLQTGREFVAAVAGGDRTHLYGGVPQLAADRGSARVLVNTGYVAGYSDDLGNPLWVAYRVTDGGTRDAPPRPDGFSVDRRTAARIGPEVYTGSGYDRGHLAPNHTIATRHGRRAQEETFLMSNIVPQAPSLNGGLWKRMEQRIATNYPGRFGEVWVITGPVFGPRPPRLRGRVAVPEAFFLIVVDESAARVRAAGVILPQEVPTGARLEDYVVSIDEIERRTGLDFLHLLPDEAETALETTVPARWW